MIIAKINARITSNAHQGWWSPKNTILHSEFNTSCTLNAIYPLRLVRFLLDQTIYKLSPINKYSTDQTGPNTSFGGLNHGLFSVSYQVGMLGIVARLPIAPAANGATIAIINLSVLFILSSIHPWRSLWGIEALKPCINSRGLPRSWHSGTGRRTPADFSGGTRP